MFLVNTSSCPMNTWRKYLITRAVLITRALHQMLQPAAVDVQNLPSGNGGNSSFCSPPVSVLWEGYRSWFIQSSIPYQTWRTLWLFSSYAPSYLAFLDTPSSGRTVHDTSEPLGQVRHVALLICWYSHLLSPAMFSLFICVTQDGWMGITEELQARDVFLISC